MNVIEWKDVLHPKARKDQALRSHCRSASAENVVIDPFIALQNQSPLLLNCSPWGLEESDTTERLHFHFSLSHIGEGNGNPLQCSCLENPRDGGAWWAAIYGIAQSRTRLK